MKKLLLVSLFLFQVTLDACPFKFLVYRFNGDLMNVEAYEVDFEQNNHQTLRTILANNNIDVDGLDVFNGSQFSSIDLRLTQENYDQLVQEHDRSQNPNERYIVLFPKQADEGVEE